MTTTNALYLKEAASPTRPVLAAQGGEARAREGDVSNEAPSVIPSAARDLGGGVSAASRSLASLGMTSGPAASMLVSRHALGASALACVMLAAGASTVAAAGSGAAENGEASAGERQVVDRRVVVVRPGAHRAAFPLLQAQAGYLGVQLLELTPELRAHFGVAQESGVLVARVEPGSPAANAGLLVGDILTAIGGEPAESPWQVGRTVGRRDEGDQVELELWRGGRRLELAAVVSERERPQLDLVRTFALGGEDEPLPFDWEVGPGMEVHRLEIDPEEIQKLVGGFEAKLGPDLQRRLQSYRERNAELEQRLAELEARLRAIEQQIGADGR